jgi:3-deoxy-7-phosphoheptulonate synthase
MFASMLRPGASSLVRGGPDLADWKYRDWRRRPTLQQPPWPDPLLLGRVATWLSARPRLVQASEVSTLREALAAAASGHAFVIQAGDCAESLEAPVGATAKMSVELLHGAARDLEVALGVPVIPVGRIAGQYAKPRSFRVERVGGVDLPAFQGYCVNSADPDLAARVPDATRLIRGYQHSRDTLAVLRAGSTGCGHPAGSPPPGCPSVWASHEALILDYEEAFVRRDRSTGDWFLSSAHLPWIGLRTSAPDGAHVRFLSGVANPVGCKVGPETEADDLLEACAWLDPDRTLGRLVLIARMGADQIEARLPRLVAGVARAGHPCAWLCDPMHGNTVKSAAGYKVRHVSTIVAELEAFFRLFREAGIWPAGIHLEAVGQHVTECIGGNVQGVAETDVPRRYLSPCDPRLNARQTREVIARVAELGRYARSRPGC